MTTCIDTFDLPEFSMERPPTPECGFTHDHPQEEPVEYPDEECYSSEREVDDWAKDDYMREYEYEEEYGGINPDVIDAAQDEAAIACWRLAGGSFPESAIYNATMRFIAKKGYDEGRKRLIAYQVCETSRRLNDGAGSSECPSIKDLVAFFEE